MPIYEFLCEKCQSVEALSVPYEDRDLPRECEGCGNRVVRIWMTAPSVRTTKTSRSYLDGQRSDGFSEEVKAAKLDAEAMNYSPKSDKYKELKAEAAARRLVNNNPKVLGKRYRMSNSKKKK